MVLCTSHRLGQQGPSTAGSCVIHHEQGMGGPGQDHLRLPNRSGGSHASQRVVELHVPHFKVAAKLLTSLWLHQHPYCAPCRRRQRDPSAGHVAISPGPPPCQLLAGCSPSHQSRCRSKATGQLQQLRKPCGDQFRRWHGQRLPRRRMDKHTIRSTY